MSNYNSFYMSDRALERAIEEVEENFSTDRLNNRISMVISDIKDMQEAIQRCQKFLSHAYYQKQLLNDINYKCSVYWIRRSGTPVYYYVGVHRTPNVPKGEHYRDTIEPQRFQGKNRKAAKDYAKKLCEKYKCILEDCK